MVYVLKMTWLLQNHIKTYDIQAMYRYFLQYNCLIQFHPIKNLLLGHSTDRSWLDPTGHHHGNKTSYNTMLYSYLITCLQGWLHSQGLLVPPCGNKDVCWAWWRNCWRTCKKPGFISSEKSARFSTARSMALISWAGPGDLPRGFWEGTHASRPARVPPLFPGGAGSRENWLGC